VRRVAEQLRAEVEKRIAEAQMERDCGRAGWRLRAGEHERVAALCRRAAEEIEGTVELLAVYGEQVEA
jgi:hypothetical protein